MSKLSRNPFIRRLPFDDQAIAVIGRALAVDPAHADFQLPGSTVWQTIVQGTNGRPQALVTLWPGIKRVDVICGATTIVFTGIQAVEVVPEVEVQFRRANRECLIVARNGQVIVRV